MNTQLFHGTYAHAVDQLRPSDRGFFGGGVYLSTCRDDAAQYGDRLALVSIHVKRPYLTKANFDVAEAFDCETPAGPMILELVGPEAGAEILKGLRHTEDGYLDYKWTAMLQAMGHDSICVSWPDGLQHWVVFDPKDIKIEGWVELDASIENRDADLSG